MKTNRKIVLSLIFLCFFVGSLFFYYYFLKSLEDRGYSLFRMILFAAGLGTVAAVFWRSGVGQKSRFIGRGMNIGCLTGLVVCVILGVVYEGEGLIGILLMLVLLYFGVLGVLVDGVLVIANLIIPEGDPNTDTE